MASPRRTLVFLASPLVLGEAVTWYAARYTPSLIDNFNLFFHGDTLEPSNFRWIPQLGGVATKAK